MSRTGNSYGDSMKKLISVILMICSLCLVTSYNCGSDRQKAEHTYSLLGFTVSYNYPNGYNAVSSDDDPNMGIYADGIEDKLDWSISMSVVNMNHLEFEDYKGELSKMTSDIKQNDGVWTFIYKEPQERTVILKWLECGKLLTLLPANDFNYDDALEIVRTFEIDVWGEDVR